MTAIRVFWQHWGNPRVDLVLLAAVSQAPRRSHERGERAAGGRSGGTASSATVPYVF